MLKRLHSQVIKNLESRFQITCTREINLAKPTTIYTGFDPTAKSLHVGNLLTIMALLQFQTTGHQVIALIGGATGSIGDPSGKKSERQALDKHKVLQNTDSISSQLNILFENANNYCNTRGYKIEKPAKILNNLDWFKDMTMLEFVGKVGRNARVNQMLGKDSVKGRMHGDGISFAEFAYQLLQGYDFWHLYSQHECRIQLGGSDQWGNITTGLDLIRRFNLEQDYEPAFGITIPLVTTPTGEKFGKSEGNAIWLDKDMLSVFDFYQFFRKAPDANIQQLLEYFTLLPVEEIKILMDKHQKSPEEHLAQKVLASEVTELVHGKQEAIKATVMSTVLYESSFESLESNDIHLAFAGSPRLARVNLIEMPISDFIIQTGALPSKSSVRKMIAGGGLYINKKKAASDQVITKSDFVIDNKFLLVSVGKSNYKLVELE
ncbi:tyrosyl-tRNA synthetase [Terramyces sp. JEL0728]|nr:tyrosyl-tRNA synthetase [Terramyces sp. JEL0728]